MPEEKDTKLAAALRQAKAAPMFFAFVAKGASDGVLIVNKKKVPVKEINEAKTESGGKKVYQGRCVGEDGKMVFEMAKEAPPALAKALRSVINASAGMMLQVETRVAPDLEDEGDEGEVGQAEAPQSPQSPPQAPVPQPGQAPRAPQPPGQTPPAPTTPQQQKPGPTQSAPSNDDANRFATRLKALSPIMAKVESTGSDLAKQAKAHIADANKLFVAKLYGPANGMLDKAEEVIKKALQTGPMPKAPPLAPVQQPSGQRPHPEEQESNESGEEQTAFTPAEDAARFASRLKALAPAMQKAEATGSPFAQQVKAQLAEGSKQYGAKQYGAANAALDKAEALIKQALTGTVPPPPVQPPPPSGKAPSQPPSTAPVPDKLVKALQAAVQNWQKSLEQVDGQISQLQAKLKQSNDAELHEIAEFGLNGLTANHKVPLIVALRNVNGAQGSALRKGARKAQTAAAAFLQHINTDDAITACDDNPFGAPTTIRSSLGGSLGQLVKALQDVASA